ncbi:MAG: hypothetical protein J6J74_08375 [Elusimicrobiaceae bacterium]|nr:hypothetical protein [Elusimicrobiaceae bacterium]
MKRKWLAGCLACLLLLCGCRAVEPITSASANVKTTTHNTTRSTPKTHRDPTFVRIPYLSLDEYRKTVSKVHSVQDLSSIFLGKSVSEENMTMLLKDRFFVLPQLNKNIRCTKVEFVTRGITSFRCEVNETCYTHKSHEPCYMSIDILHRKTEFKSYGENTAVLDTDFLTADGTRFTVVESVKEKYDEWADAPWRTYYHWTDEGYLIAVSTDANCDTEEDCLEKYVKELRFEKVEIK